MTTDTKPSEAALEIARKILDDFDNRPAWRSDAEPWLAAKIDAGVREMREATEQARGHIQWMSGSSDFGPGGCAHQGWIKVQDEMEKIETALRAWRTK